MTLWTHTQAEAATGGRATAPFAASGLSIDTRSLMPGDLFVALKAARDGHDFVAQAFEKGAAAALVDHVPPGVTGPCLVVPDVLAALTALGAAGRARARAQVVAVTGSVGKTSTKEMLRLMLAEFGSVHAAEASFNNHWGVPITLARLPPQADFAVVEIGMNHPGEIAPLSRLTRPHVAMITTIAPAHLAAFESIEGIAHEKSDIYCGLEPDGIALFPTGLGTTPILESRARLTRALSFGPEAEICQTFIRQTNGMTIVSARVDEQVCHVRLVDAGAHFAANAVGCLAVAQALNLDLALAAQALGRWRPPSGRGRRETRILDAISEAQFWLIDDAFNANPASLAAALDVLAASPVRGSGRRIAILGDMLELGETETALHRAVADLPAMASVDLVHCVGPRMAHLWQALPAARRGRAEPTAEAMVARIAGLVRDGDVVLVKGSKGSYVSRVVDALRRLAPLAPDDPTGET